MIGSGVSLQAVQEKQRFKEALNLISVKYAPFIAANPYVQVLMTKYNLLVKFMAPGPFNTNRLLSGKPSVGCTVNGFTDYLTDPPTIYINRGTATPATLVHELLHYLTHANFRNAFQTHPDWIEGVTEYFTRKVIGRANPLNPLQSQFIVDRAGIYDTEHGTVTDGRKLLKGPFNPQKPPKDFMKKAYFEGDQASIQILQSLL